jgi:hypothetical protein
MHVLQPSRGDEGRQFNISDYLSPAEVANIQSERSFNGAKGFIDAFHISSFIPEIRDRISLIGGNQLPRYEDGTRTVTINSVGEGVYRTDSALTSGQRDVLIHKTVTFPKNDFVGSIQISDDLEPIPNVHLGDDPYLSPIPDFPKPRYSALDNLSILGSPSSYDFQLNTPQNHAKACQVIGRQFQETASGYLESNSQSGLLTMRNYLIGLQAYIDGASQFYNGLGLESLGKLVRDLTAIRNDLNPAIRDCIVATRKHPDTAIEPLAIGDMPQDSTLSWGSRFAWDIIQKLAGNYMPNYQPKVDTRTYLYRHDEMFSPRFEKQGTATQGTIDFSIPIKERPIPERAQRIFIHLKWDSERDVLPELVVFGGFESVRALREEELKIEKRNVPLNNVGAEAVKSTKDILAKIYNV